MHRSTGPISPISVAPSTKSWVTFNPPNPGPPPPPPVRRPSPPSPAASADTLKPLPDMYSRRQPFRVVNTMDPPRPVENDQHEIRTPDANLAAYNQARRPIPPLADLRPLNRKKPSLVGGFVKGIRQLPRSVFGYGSAPPTPESSTQRVRVNLDAESPPASRVTSPESTPGQLYHLPSISARSAAQPYQVQPPMRYTPPRIQNRDSPLPEVVRVGDHRDNRPIVKVTSPSPDIANEERAEIYDAPLEPPDFDHPPARGPTPSALERTTVMVYHDDRTSRTPSMAPVLTNEPRLGPTEGAQLLEPLRTQPAQNVTYAQPPTRSRPLPTPIARPPSRTLPPVPPAPVVSAYVPTTMPLPAPVRQAPPIMIPPTITSVPDVEPEAPPVELSEPPQSVVEPHLEPTSDYRKMGGAPTATTPTHTTRTRRTRTTWTSYFNPSFISDYHPVEKFCKLFYQLPWIAQERVTVDYMPGDVRKDGKQKKKYNKPMRSWYHTVLSASRRNSATIDLLSNGSPSQRSDGTSQNQLSLTSPMSDDSGYRRRRHNSHREHRHDRHHRSHHHSHHRRRTTSDSGHRHRHRSHSRTPPLPAVYPFPYTPYPIHFPVPAPAMAPPPKADLPNNDKSTPRGPDNQPIPKALQPGLGYPHGYSPFPPFMPPPMYIMQPPPMQQQPHPRTKTPASSAHPSATSPPAQEKPTSSQSSHAPEIAAPANAAIPGAFVEAGVSSEST